MSNAMNLDSLVGKEVVVWPRTNEPFLLCTEQQGGGIVPLVGQDENGGPRLQIAPFVTGELHKLSDGTYAVRYTLPDRKAFFVVLNLDAVANVTYADPRNGSGVILGV